MSVARTVSEVREQHVSFEVESIDRMYLNLYVPRLQRVEGVAYYWIYQRGARFASTALMAPMTAAFVRSVEQFARREGVELVAFAKGQRKDDQGRRGPRVPGQVLARRGGAVHRQGPGEVSSCAHPEAG